MLKKYNMKNTINKVYDNINKQEFKKCERIQREIKESVFYNDGLILI